MALAVDGLPPSTRPQNWTPDSSSLAQGAVHGALVPSLSESHGRGPHTYGKQGLPLKTGSEGLIVSDPQGSRSGQEGPHCS
jgi:hypothetical protein